MKVTTVKQINEASRYFSLLNNDENIFSNNNGNKDDDEDEDEDEINNNLDNENNPESDDIMSGYVYNDEVEFVIERKDKFGNDIEDDDIRDFMVLIQNKFFLFKINY